MNDIWIFTLVVEHGSFTRAAKALGLPLSTVSRRISRLEEGLGARLLQRTTRKLSLTDAGRLYHDRASRGVEELEHAYSAVARLQTAPRGKVRVTAPVDMVLVTSLAATFLRQHADVQMELDFTNRYVDLVAEGYDLALRAGALTDSSLIVRRLAEMATRLVASPAYRRRRGLPRSPDELREHDCIIFGPLLPSPTWSLDGPQGQVSVPIKGQLAVNHMEAARDAALAGLGIACLPEPFCAEPLRDGRLEAVLPDLSPPGGSMSIVYPSRRHLAPAVRAFASFLQAHFAEAVRQDPGR